MIGYDRHAMYTALQPIETYIVSSESSSSEEEEEVQVDEPSVDNNDSTNVLNNEDELIVVDETVPSSSNKEYISNNEINEPIASTSMGRTEEPPKASIPLIISSDESDRNRGSQDDEIEVVDYVKPLRDRTPVIVNIDSSDEDIINREKKTTVGVSCEIETANSTSSPANQLDNESPAIVILDDSSPESNHSVSDDKNPKCDKPLWKRNFETCFPKSRDSSSKRASKKRVKTKRKRCYTSSSSSDREKSNSRNKEIQKRNREPLLN